MSTPVNHEEYLSKLKATTWKDHLITSEGNIVAKGSWLGRLCSCSSRKGFSISQAQIAVLDKVFDYMKNKDTMTAEELATRSAIATAAIANFNALIDHVKAIRPTSTLEKIDLDLKTDAKDVVEEIDSSSVEVDTAPAATVTAEPVVQSSVDESVETRKRRKRDDETVKAGHAFVQQFDKSFKAKTSSVE